MCFQMKDEEWMSIALVCSVGCLIVGEGGGNLTETGLERNFRSCDSG